MRVIFLCNSFVNLNLRSSYESGQDDLVEEFYAPVLRCAKSYDRIAGFFTSSSLAIAAKGMAGFIRNHGVMRLIACPRLDEKDAEILELVNTNPDTFLSDKYQNMFDDLEDSLQEQHISALGWMIANGYLEIKLAVVKKTGKFCTGNEIDQSGIFHQKVGILTDFEGNKISFSGSINETASGWLHNVEEFKVFSSWNDEKKYLVKDEQKFYEFWNNKRNNVQTYNLPESVKKKLIEKSTSFRAENNILQSYKRYVDKKNILDNSLSLFYYQKNAVKKWIRNDYKLLFQMATGTGKTRTAFGCIAELMLTHKKLIVIIACPQGTLSLQWKNEIDSLPFYFDISAVIDGTNKKWRTTLQETVLRIATGFIYTAVLFTTHVTASKPDFIKTVEESKPTNDVVDIVMSRGTSSNTNNEMSDSFSAIAERAFQRERQISHTPFSITKKDLQENAVKSDNKKSSREDSLRALVGKTLGENLPKSFGKESLLDKVEEYSAHSDINIVLKKPLTDREQLVFEYFLNNIGKTVFAKDLAELLELPRDYVYKYIKNLRAKIEGDKLKNVPSGGFVLTE